jgi:hypothetical protein
MLYHYLIIICLQGKVLPISLKLIQESCMPHTGVLEGKRKVLLITGAAGFVGMHTALHARRCGYGVSGTRRQRLHIFVMNTGCVHAGVLGLDNFNNYYPVSLKRARMLTAILGKYVV